MKRSQQIIVMAVLLLVSLACSPAASASVYTWSRYDLTFETPDGGFVTFNSATRFEIQWEDMVMTVQLFSKNPEEQGKEKKLLNENLMRKALGYSMYDLNNGKMKVKGFKSVYTIDGTMPDGSRAIIADLVSKKQDLIVEVTINYLYGNRETAEDIIKSFAENKKQQPNHEPKHQKVQSKEDAEREQKAKEKNEKKPVSKPKEHLYDA